MHNSSCRHDSNLLLCKCLRQLGNIRIELFTNLGWTRNIWRSQMHKKKQNHGKVRSNFDLKTGINFYWFVCGNAQMYLSPKMWTVQWIHYLKWITSNAIQMQNAFVLWYTAAAATATANVERWDIIVEKALIMLKAVYSGQDLQMADLIRWDRIVRMWDRKCTLHTSLLYFADPWPFGIEFCNDLCCTLPLTPMHVRDPFCLSEVSSPCSQYN